MNSEQIKAVLDSVVEQSNNADEIQNALSSAATAMGHLIHKLESADEAETSSRIWLTKAIDLVGAPADATYNGLLCRLEWLWNKRQEAQNDRDAYKRKLEAAEKENKQLKRSVDELRVESDLFEKDRDTWKAKAEEREATIVKPKCLESVGEGSNRMTQVNCPCGVHFMIFTDPGEANVCVCGRAYRYIPPIDEHVVCIKKGKPKRPERPKLEALRRLSHAHDVDSHIMADAVLEAIEEAGNGSS